MNTTNAVFSIFLTTFAVCGCVTRQQVMADVYQHDQIPASLCAQLPQIKNYGIYRVVACSSKPSSTQCQNGQKAFEEVRSYCAPSIKNYLGMSQDDVNKWLGQLTAPKSQ